MSVASIGRYEKRSLHGRAPIILIPSTWTSYIYLLVNDAVIDQKEVTIPLGETRRTDLSGTARESGATRVYIASEPLMNLTVTLSGPGTVTGRGLTCSGSTCRGSYARGASFTITAIPNSNSVFTGFSSGCDSVAGSTCSVTMNSDKNISAVFGAISPCTYTLSSSRRAFPYRGGNVNVIINAKGAKACASPRFSSNVEWLEPTLSFKNNRGILKIVARPNGTITDRTGTISMEGTTFIVTEAAFPCSITGVSVPGAVFTFSGGSGSFSVSATEGCPWTVVAGASWLTITGADGVGSGMVSYTASPNNGKNRRSGKITVELNQNRKKKRTFTVTEKK